MVIQALGALGLAGINQALAKGGEGISFPAPIIKDGPGWRADVDLPRGVTDLDDELRTQLHFNGSARAEQETEDPR